MRKNMIFILALFMVFMLASCNTIQNDQSKENMDTVEDVEDVAMVDIALTEGIKELEDDLSAVRYEGNYGFDEFLSGGGADSDREVIEFLTQNLLNNLDMGFVGGISGCSTIATQNADGEVLFGRNFDWNSCDAIVVMSYPENAYASISTVNMDFIRQGAGGVAGLALKADEVVNS